MAPTLGVEQLPANDRRIPPRPSPLWRQVCSQVVLVAKTSTKSKLTVSSS